jgi:S1-C subfamily serine protease
MTECLPSLFAEGVRIASVCILGGLFCVTGCNKPTVDKSTATLMSFSNASQTLSARVLPAVIRLDVDYQHTPVNDQFEYYYGSDPGQSQIGSGVIISKDGLALTNYHVVRGAKSIYVSLLDGRKAEAEIVGTDALTDLALLRLPFSDLPAIQWSDSDKLYAGALVWSFGSPWGLDGSVSLGVISSSLRNIHQDNPFHDYLQTDASINPGISGGPLINAAGKIVGICTAIEGDQFSGIGYAIPTNVAKAVAKQLQEHGKIDRAWIGVELSEIRQDDAILAGLPDVRGAILRNFADPKTPAEIAGLKAGDLLLEVNGEKVSGPKHAQRLIASAKVDAPLEVLIQRQSVTSKIVVSPKIRPTN